MGVWVKVSDGTVFILKKSSFLMKLNKYTVVHLYAQPNSLGGPLIGTVNIVIVHYVSVSCLKQIIFALQSRSPSS